MIIIVIKFKKKVDFLKAKNHVKLRKITQTSAKTQTFSFSVALGNFTSLCSILPIKQRLVLVERLAL